MIEEIALTLIASAAKLFPPIADALRSMTSDSPTAQKIADLLPEMGASEIVERRLHGDNIDK